MLIWDHQVSVSGVDLSVEVKVADPYIEGICLFHDLWNNCVSVREDYAEKKMC